MVLIWLVVGLGWFDGMKEGESQIQFHLGVDQAAADAEHPIAEDGGAEGGVEEATGDGFELGVVQFVGGRNGGGDFVVGWSAHGFDLVGGLVWLVGSGSGIRPGSCFWEGYLHRPCQVKFTIRQLIENERHRAVIFLSGTWHAGFCEGRVTGMESWLHGLESRFHPLGGRAWEGGSEAFTGSAGGGSARGPDR